MLTATTRPTSFTRYELPPGGTSLLGYIVRRLHKTGLLVTAQALLDAGRPAEALAQFALYAAASAASFGPAYYQPDFDEVGASVTEADPLTGIPATARLEARSPHLGVSYQVALPDGSRFRGQETITGTTFGLRGLGMPAPSRFEYLARDQDYRALGTGLIVSELAPRLFRPWHIRARGRLELSDNRGHGGSLSLARSGAVAIEVHDGEGRRLTRREAIRSRERRGE